MRSTRIPRILNRVVLTTLATAVLVAYGAGGSGCSAGAVIGEGNGRSGDGGGPSGSGGGTHGSSGVSSGASTGSSGAASSSGASSGAIFVADDAAGPVTSSGSSSGAPPWSPPSLDGSLPYTCPGGASSLPYLGLSTKPTVLGSSYPPFWPSQPGGALVPGTTYDTTALVAYVYGTGTNCLPVYDTGTGSAWTAFRAEITVGDPTACAVAGGGCNGNTYAARVDQQREGSSEVCAGTPILVGSVPGTIPPFEVSMDGSTLYMFLGGCEGGYGSDAAPLGSSGWQVWATLTRVTPDGG